MKGQNVIDQVYAVSSKTIILLVAIATNLWAKFIGFLANIPIPYPLRGLLYGIYAWSNEAKMEEAKEPNLYHYRSFSEWFRRPLKPELRPISPAELVSPVDGEILHLGEVKNGRLREVKGYDYDVKDFLGDVDFKKTSEDNRLYEVTIVLRTGNYHGMHAPADFAVKQILNIPGMYLTPKPFYLTLFPRLMQHDERAVLSGSWKYGYFSMTAVAAMRVGDIIIYTDPPNEAKEVIVKEKHDYDPPIQFKSGNKLGEFRFGSTVVLIFEAPPRFKLYGKAGDTILYGQRLVAE
ncbi:CRE-PSD-1 protein [Aphelenchoides avenae]|nr:CRE-PSD-1 protein [Aphelenchus avenae]